MPKLGVNIDHVATLRQARLGSEPDPVWAAVESELAGAHVITLHLREDRRHVQEHDFHRLQAVSKVKVNLEMAASKAMTDFALKNSPEMVTLVPEGRQELTTEGGLDLNYEKNRLVKFVDQAKSQGIEVSAFIEPDEAQIKLAQEMGFDTCELHTGHYAEVFMAEKQEIASEKLQAELFRIKKMTELIYQMGMKPNAGHALDYRNVTPIAEIPHVNELHIGFSIISRSIFTGIKSAVSEMLGLIR